MLVSSGWWFSVHASTPVSLSKFLVVLGENGFPAGFLESGVLTHAFDGIWRITLGLSCDTNLLNMLVVSPDVVYIYIHISYHIISYQLEP